MESIPAEAPRPADTWLRADAADLAARSWAMLSSMCLTCTSLTNWICWRNNKTFWEERNEFVVWTVHQLGLENLWNCEFKLKPEWYQCLRSPVYAWTHEASWQLFGYCEHKKILKNEQFREKLRSCSVKQKAQLRNILRLLETCWVIDAILAQCHVMLLNYRLSL